MNLLFLFLLFSSLPKTDQPCMTTYTVSTTLSFHGVFLSHTPLYILSPPPHRSSCPLPTEDGQLLFSFHVGEKEIQKRKQERRPEE